MGGSTRKNGGGGTAKKACKSAADAKQKPASELCCTCNGERELGTLELYCNGCNKWFHARCLTKFKTFNALAFMVSYVFNCPKCSSRVKDDVGGSTKDGTWIPKTANFAHMCMTALANMSWQRKEKGTDKETKFSLQKEIIPYFEKQWEFLTPRPRPQKQTWHQTLLKTLSKETELFVCWPSSSNRIDDGYFSLVETDFSKIGPNHEVVKQVGRKAGSQEAITGGPLTGADGGPCGSVGGGGDDGGPKTRGAKRKAEGGGAGSNPAAGSLSSSYRGSASSLSGDTNGASLRADGTAPKKSKTTGDYTSTKLAGYSVPVDHPFNRDGYRYFLVESDPHSPNRKEFEDQEETAGKPIPAYMYRIVRPSVVELSSHDRAPQLKLNEDHLTVTGEKGYSVVRASHGVNRGAWYFEMEMVDQPAGSHVRFGWSQGLGCLQAPVGYDKFSYCWRSRKGTRFHDSAGKHYASSGYGEGDVLGSLIELPVEGVTSDQLPECHKTLPLIKFKNHYYYEEKDDPQKVLKQLKPMPGSKITFFKNGVSQGVAFTDVAAACYYPAVSLYKNAIVRLNFGPDFKHSLPIGAEPMSNRAAEVAEEQCLSDILFFVENEGKLGFD